jgi:hypothetical protein
MKRKQLSVELRTYTKKQIQQFIEDDKLTPEQQRIADEFARQPSRETRTEHRGAQEVLKVAGVWSDLEWEKTQKELDRIRDESKPTPPFDLHKDPEPGQS